MDNKFPKTETIDASFLDKLNTHISKDTRFFVMECSVLLEAKASETLSLVLNIPNWINSESLGSKTSSLSFNSKILLLIDTAYLTKEDRKDFITFMEIRNKFAHVLECESYESLIASTPNIQNKINNIPPFVESGVNSEPQFKFFIFLLTHNLFHKLVNAQLQHNLTQITKDVHTSYTNILFSEMEQATSQNPLLLGAITNIFERVKDKWLSK